MKDARCTPALGTSFSCTGRKALILMLVCRHCRCKWMVGKSSVQIWLCRQLDTVRIPALCFLSNLTASPEHSHQRVFIFLIKTWLPTHVLHCPVQPSGTGIRTICNFVIILLCREHIRQICRRSCDDAVQGFSEPAHRRLLRIRHSEFWIQGYYSGARFDMCEYVVHPDR